MSAAHSEFNSFIRKFYQLWQAGVTANFHAETHAGMAWVQVRAQLGRAPAPADRRPQAQHQPGLRRRRGPAHERRKVRRAAARTAAAAAEQAAAYEAVTEEMANPVTEEVTNPATEEVADPAETVTEEVDSNESVTEMVAYNENVAEKATKTKEAAKRKGSPLLKVAKHLKFANVTIRKKKKKKLLISRSSPSPQKAEQRIAEDMSKETVAATTAWVTAAVTAVGIGVAATARKISEEDAAKKRAEEEAVKRDAEEEAARRKGIGECCREATRSLVNGEGVICCSPYLPRPLHQSAIDAYEAGRFPQHIINMFYSRGDTTHTNYVWRRCEETGRLIQFEIKSLRSPSGGNKCTVATRSGRLLSPPEHETPGTFPECSTTTHGPGAVAFR